MAGSFLELKFEGGEEIAANLLKLPAAVGRKTQVDALIAGAEPMQRAMGEGAPRGVGAKHLADNIVIGQVSAASSAARGREGETVIEVGPAHRPDDYFYGFYVEFGTAHSGATPFMRPAFDRSTSVSLYAILQKFWTALRAALPGGGSSTVGGRFA